MSLLFVDPFISGSFFLFRLYINTPALDALDIFQPLSSSSLFFLNFSPVSPTFSFSTSFDDVVLLFLLLPFSFSAPTPFWG